MDMPDTTRTAEDFSAIELARELVKIAMAGLQPGMLAQRSDRFPMAFGLDRVRLSSDRLDQATTLVECIIRAARTIPGEKVSLMAQALFGVENRFRDVAYDERRGNAVEIWDPEGVRKPDNFARRQIPKITEAMALALMNDSNGLPTTQTFILGTARLADQKKTEGLDRLAFRAETWLTERGQRAYVSEWTFKDKATRAGIDAVRVFRRAMVGLTVEPASDTIDRVEYRGTDNAGWTVWLVRFRDTLAVGQEIEWKTRTVYGTEHLNAVKDYEELALTVSHSPPKGPILRGTFIAHFDMRFPPERLVRFETPKGTFPDILGPTQNLAITSGAARADFQDLQPWWTYGICWWPQRDST